MPLVQLVTDNDQTHVKLRGQGVVFQAWPRMMTIEIAAIYLGLSAKTIRNHGNRLPGRRSWGGKVVALDLVEGQSTSGILERIVRSWNT